jgi:hypothetical protein
MHNEKPQATRRPYEAPQLDVIDLAADEVLLVGCKTGIALSAQSGSPCQVQPGCQGDNAS